MFPRPKLSETGTTLLTLAIGALGAALGARVGLPLYVLCGPALLVCALSLAGLRLGIATLFRDVAFIFIGIGVGAGVNNEAAAAMLRWPLAFVVLALMVLAAMIVCRIVLVRGFGFTPTAGILAGAPGHLSFVLALGDSYKENLPQIAVTQSVRVLLLTLTVPLIAALMGLDVTDAALPNGTTLSLMHLGVLTALAVGVGWVMERLRVPAPLLIGAMLVSATGHLSELAPGVLEPRVTQVCLVLMGSLIGSRFAGTAPRMVLRYAGAGLSITFVTVTLSVAAAIPMALFLDMPLAHVLVAFAPGGLETMIVMGAVLGANPGFVAACHVGRLLVLSVLIPTLAARAGKDR